MRTKQRRITIALVATLSMVAASCGGGTGDAASTRRVFVDHSSDEFASFSLSNYPAKVKVRQGDVIEFKQTWTGEPHTVTGGSTISENLQEAETWIEFFDSFEALFNSGASLPNPEDPGDATVGDLARAIDEAKDDEAREQFVRAYEGLVALGVEFPTLDPTSTQPFSEVVSVIEVASEEAFTGLPDAFDDDGELSQNLGQPCFLDEGGPPEDPATACAKADQEQPAFTGRQSYFNSGVIRYEGERSNTFRVQIASDAKTGSFLFYCAIHGFGQRSAVEIVDAAADVPTQSQINTEVRAATSNETKVLGEIFRDAEDDLTVELPGFDEPLQGPFAGLPGEDHTGINEFVPRQLAAKVGDPITWKMMGADHTISFNVPKYFPIMEFLDDGTVRINPKMRPAAGDAVPYEPPEESEGEDVATRRHDGGTFDGDGFWSSGLISSHGLLEYTLRISKPGTFSYACLLHPQMIGDIKVTS